MGECESLTEAVTETNALTGYLRRSGRSLYGNSLKEEEQEVALEVAWGGQGAEPTLDGGDMKVIGGRITPRRWN